MTKRPMLPDPNGGRSIPEWIGATPDAKIPKPVLLRIFRRADGRCHISGRKIAPGERWQAEHIIPLSAKGQHRESNLAPALIEPHKEKSKKETKQRAKADAVAKKAAGITQPKGEIKSRGFTPVEKPPKAGAIRIEKPALSTLGQSNIARQFGIK